jgi:hypothetical protein
MDSTQLLGSREKAERPDLDETVINGPAYDRTLTRGAAPKQGSDPARPDEPDGLSSR